MATKLDAALERIDVAVDRIRTKVSKPTETIEEVATAVEALGTGGSSEGLYKVKTIAERDVIEAEEGDTCLVLESSIANLKVDDSVTNVTFPAVVTLPEAFDGYGYMSLRDADRLYDVMVMLEPTMCRIDIMVGEEYSQINYTSEDSITFTKDEGVEGYEFPVPISCAYPEEWIDEIGYFIQVGSVNFDGIFEYIDGAWEFANVGLSADSSMMFKPSGGYTNAGTVIGDLDRKQFRKSNIYVQDTEPEDKKGIWVVSKERVYNDYTNEQVTGTTEVDLNNPITFTKGTSYAKYFSYHATLAQHAYCFTDCRASVFQTSTSEGDSDTDICILGTNAYCFNFWSDSSKSFAVKVNLETGAKTTLTKYSSSSYVWGMDNRSALSSDGTNIYCLARKKGDTGNVSLCVYSISGNSWTTISTPFVNRSSLYYQYNHNEAAMCIGPGLILLTGKTYEANTTSATRVLFWLYDYTNRTVVADFYIDRADLNSNDTKALLDLFSGTYSFYIEEGILKFPNSDFEISTSNFTKESVIAAENARTKYLKSSGFIFNHDLVLNPDCTIGTYQGNIGMTLYKDGKMYKMYPKYPEDLSSSELEYVISYIKDNTLYSTFLCDNSTHYIFAADVSNPEEYTHVDSNLWASIQVGTDGTPCEIAEGLSLNVKNFHIHNYVGSSTNAAYKVYIGDGTSWTLISENS